MRVALAWIAVAEVGLAAVALLWAGLREIPIRFALDLQALGLALGAAMGLVALNLSLYRLARRKRQPYRVLDFLEREIFPLFRGASLASVVLLASLAGLGEELFFRAVLQQELGLLATSALFGLAHGPSRSLFPLAAWAFLMGNALGLLYEESGSFLVPAIAHALYDAAALAYIRRLPAPGSLDEVRDGA